MLADLVLIKDEPAQKLMFGFEQMVTQLFNDITDKETPTPFMIAVHGECGGGKTSLISAVYNRTKPIKEDDTTRKILKFNAWEYERTDIVVALLQKILTKYDSVTKNSGVSASNLIADVMLRKTVGIDKDDAEKRLTEFVKQKPTIRKNLENLTKGNRLIVFVDDLDKCNVENISDMLEAITMFFAVEGVIFVVAADMDKIGQALQSHHNNKITATESQEHTKKIFQLNLSLPFKNNTAISEFVSGLYPEFLGRGSRKELLVLGCKHNLRNIIQILNRVRSFILGLYADIMFECDCDVELVISWCVLASSFPKFAKQVKNDPLLLFRTSYVCCLFKNLHALSDINTANLEHEIQTRVKVEDDNILETISGDSIQKQLKLIKENADDELFQFLHRLGQHYEFDGEWKAIKDFRDRIDKLNPHLQKIITYGGLLPAHG